MIVLIFLAGCVGNSDDSLQEYISVCVYANSNRAINPAEMAAVQSACEKLAENRKKVREHQLFNGAFDDLRHNVAGRMRDGFDKIKRAISEESRDVKGLRASFLVEARQSCYRSRTPSASVTPENHKRFCDCAVIKFVEELSSDEVRQLGTMHSLSESVEDQMMESASKCAATVQLE